MYKNIYLKKGKEESMKRFHPWVFSGAVHHMDEGIEEGEVVNVIASYGEFIGRGHYQIGSIAVRILTFDDELIDDAFWQKRLNIALHPAAPATSAEQPPEGPWSCPPCPFRAREGPHLW